MAFSFGGGQALGGAGAAQAQQGPELPSIETEQLGFQGVSKDDKLRLLPSPWPSDSLPPPTASLLTVASSKGLVAAAGPETLILARTETVRTALREGAIESGVRSYTPEAAIQIPRVSQVTFSSDESCLVIAAEQGGGIAVYDTNALVNGGKEPAFQLATEGKNVRQLLPNPNPSSATAHLFGMVLAEGLLLLADLKKQEMVKTGSGNAVFHERVTCACWSKLGKQIVVGRQDGTAAQIDPLGNVKAEIPYPPQLQGQAATNYPLSSIYWLETNDFLLVHSPPNPQKGGDAMADAGMPPEPACHLARREGPSSTNWTFQTIIDPCLPAMEATRTPARHFIQRLKDWPPNLDDVLLMTSTTSPDIGMLTKSKTPLGSGMGDTTNVFTTTASVDTRRAGLPMSLADGTSDTSPIGMAMDLSATEKAMRPIPSDETLDQSPVPVPALYVLNNEGLLSTWWVIYNESVKNGVPYPDLIAAGGPRPLETKKENTPSMPAATSTASQNTPFGAMAPSSSRPAFRASPFGAKPASQPGFGGSTFGAPSTPGFGGASALGSKPSLWGASAAQPSASPASPSRPTFGSSTPIGAAGGGFGQLGAMGANKPSAWGTPQSSAQPSTTSTFGKPSAPFGGNASAQSPFMSFGAQKEGAQNKPNSVFGGGGQSAQTFGGLGAAKESQPSTSLFGKPTVSGETSFGSTATIGSGSSLFGSTVGQPTPTFGTPSQNGASGLFGRQAQSREETMEDDEETPSKPAESGAPFGLGSGGFKLGSTFKSDGSAKDDAPKPAQSSGSMFGNDFLGGVSKPNAPITPIKKEPGTEDGPRLSDIPEASTTPAGPPKPAEDPLKYQAKRFAGDLPPVDVPGVPDVAQTKHSTSDVPPMDVPAEKAPPSAPAQDEQKAEQPLAGSPPVDLGNEKFSKPAGSEEGEVPEGPPDEDDDEDFGGDDDEEDDDEEEDDDREDDEDDEGDEEHTPRISDPKGLSAFEARLAPASPKRNERQEESTTPATEKKKDSYTPAGFPKAPITFPPPQKVQESPRSPSPVRSVTAPLSKPPYGGQQQHMSKPLPSSIQQISVPPAKPVERPAAPPKPAESEAGELEDEEDARVKAILNSKPEPTTELPHFFAHQDYVGQTDKPGIGGQIERVYRDVNSMIDVLGLNAHSLQGFVDGHMQMRAGEEQDADLYDEEDWRLGEQEMLSRIQDEIEQNLEEERIDDVQGKLETLREEGKDVATLRAKTAELRKQIAARTDPGQLASQYAAPLPTETQHRQSELRQGAQRVQKLLAQAEEGMSLLRADLASLPPSSGEGKTNGAANVPTVEAVTNTILKMTAMIEKRSGDIDVLEAQIRRLPNGLASLNLRDDYEDDLVASMKGSKLLGNGSPRTTSITPSRARMLANGDAPGLSAMLGSSRFRTPPSSSVARRSVMFSPEASMFGRSTGGSARKKMVDVTEEEVAMYHDKTSKRRRVLEALRKRVEEKAARVTGLDE